MHIMTASGRGLLSALAVAGLATSARAQVGGAISFSGGVATDQRGQRSNAVGVAPRLDIGLGQRAHLSLSGNATRFVESTWSLGGGAELAARESVAGPFTATLNASAAMSRLAAGTAGTAGTAGNGSTFAAAEIVPALEWRYHRVTVFGALKAASGRSTELRSAGGGLPLGNTLASRDVVRTGTGSAFGGTVIVAQLSQGHLVAGARQELLAVQGTTVRDRLVSAGLSGHRASLSASAGRRSAPDENRGLSSVQLNVVLTPTLSLDFAAARYGSNRVLGTPGGDYASAGLSWRFHRDREWTPPAPSHVPAPARGLTRLAIRAPQARVVEVAGDFNDWTPTPATRAGNGVWYADMRIPPGRYRYAFRINGGAWRVPDGAAAVDDGFGGQSAWLVVNEPDRPQ
jgi:hypothetical protein